MTQDNPNTPTRKKAIIWSLVTLLLLAILGGLLIGLLRILISYGQASSRRPLWRCSLLGCAFG